ncbi:MAG: hypothetical protein ACQESR_26730 [Planctomycetota bacterium]
MEGCPAQAVLPSVGLAANKVIRDRYNEAAAEAATGQGREQSMWAIPKAT